MSSSLRLPETRRALHSPTSSALLKSHPAFSTPARARARRRRPANTVALRKGFRGSWPCIRNVAVQRLWQVLHLGKFRSSSSFEHGQAVKLTINADVRPSIR
jgi:hypothetical protein